MNRFIVLTRPLLVNSYLLAGVEVFAFTSSEAVEYQVSIWMRENLQALLAIDEDLFTGLNDSFKKKINDSGNIFYVVIPNVVFQVSKEKWQQQIVEMIHQAIGVHISFKG